jgi:hypothetical protein
MPVPKTTVVCPHCHLQSANDKVCTNLGCGKRITDPVRLFARTRGPVVAMPTRDRNTSSNFDKRA